MTRTSKKGAKRLAPATAAICSAAMIHSLLGGRARSEVGRSGGQAGWRLPLRISRTRGMLTAPSEPWGSDLSLVSFMFQFEQPAGATDPVAASGRCSMGYCSLGLESRNSRSGECL